MAFLALPMAVLLAITGYSSAAYCVCNTALSDSVLQKNIDYACGYGADCGQISQNGPCFNPNTVKDHCTFAVNSYFQKKGQVQGSCDFSGTASVTQTPPAGANSACFSSTSTPTPPGTSTPTPPGTGIGTPTPGTGIGTPPPGTGTGTGGGVPPPATGSGIGTPPPGTGTGTPTPGTVTPGTGTGTGTGTGIGTGTGAPGINVNPPIGPTGTNGYDSSGSITIHRITNLLTPSSLLVLGFIWFRLI
ncbi:hypothetical protein L1987_16711 [Smallanthus sonchifolius]|uniref:Uncharacterized protein n=1 Tax=Smallanthus sonchifolius TaxID=185202 RepID=A0ACB9IX41_9ASTR|nr:hypothetical protein L1987_16711 [Smallanthus sonchifolius]